MVEEVKGFVCSLKDCPEFEAGDHTRLRELLHPDRHPGGFRYSLAHATLPAGQWSALHVLRHCEVYYILSGRGLVELDGVCHSVEPGDAVVIPGGCRQRAFASGPEPLQFLCVVDPAWRAEDEVILPA